MIVNDDTGVNRNLRHLLVAAGWTVSAVATDRLALLHLAWRRPSLVFVDLLLANNGIFAFLAELDQRPGERSIPVVIMTPTVLTDSDVASLRDQIDRRNCRVAGRDGGVLGIQDG